MLIYSNAVPLTRFRSFAIAVRFAGRRGDCDVRRFCQLEFPHSLRSSSLVSVRLVFSRRCCCSIRVRPVVRVGWRWVGAMRGCRDACGMAWCVHAAVVVAMGDLMMRCVWRSVRCGTKGETRGGTHGETGSERVMRRFCQLDLAVPMLSLPGVGFSGSSRPSPPWNKIPRRIGAELPHTGTSTIRTQTHGIPYIELVFGMRS